MAMDKNMKVPSPEEVLSRLPKGGGSALPSESEVEDFSSKVDEVTRLIDGLKSGALPPSYIDKRMEEKEEKKAKDAEKKAQLEEEKKLTPEREAELKEKAAALQASYERKQKARAKYEEYVKEGGGKGGAGATDYAKWDMWCPSDEEDELINKLTLPSTAEFKAMEKDIDERHNRQIEGRQIAERCRVKGNELFKSAQWAAAYDMYTEGLSYEKPNVALNANAAMASIKMGCFVQAIEHADKCVRICDFLLEKPNHPIKVKALQRKATARMSLGHYREAIDALEEALQVEPLPKADKDDLAKQLARAKAELEEDQKERRVGKAGDEEASMATLKRVEEAVQVLKQPVDGGPVGLGGALPVGKGKGEVVDGGTVGGHVAACKALSELLNESEPCRVYLRQCGGLAALVELVKGAEGAVAREAVAALTLACLNERNTKEGVKVGMYAALVTRLSSEDDELASASALLLGNCAVDVEQRKTISKVLSTNVGRGALGLSHLLRMLRPDKPPAVVASALTVLQNCAVDKPCRAAIHSLQGDQAVVPGTPLGDVSALLASNSTRYPLIRERAASLLGNFLADTELRVKSGRASSLATHLAAELPSAAAAPQCDGVLKPLLAALANCALEADACAALLSSTEVMGCLEALLRRDIPDVGARAAAVVARLVKLPAGADSLLAGEGLPTVARALHSACRRLDSSSGVAPETENELIGACCRALAIVISSGGERGASTAVRASCVPALLAAMGCPRTSDAAAGNAALCLSDIARFGAHLPLLRELDAVATLVGVAHRRSDKTAQKNASIALARMAQDSSCMARLKELHGLEIIYQNVKP